MTPVTSDDDALQLAIAEATAHLRAQICQDIAELRRAIAEAQQLVQDVRYNRQAGEHNRVVEGHKPIQLDEHVAGE